MLTNALEDLELIFSDECPCECPHRPDLPPCSGEAVALLTVTCRQYSGRICAAIVNWTLSPERRRCNGCDRPARECWVVRPI